MSYLDKVGINKGLRGMRGKNAKKYNIFKWFKKTNEFGLIHHRLKSS
jgi:hypothetical protein